MNGTNVAIIFAKTPNVEDSLALGELQDSLEGTDIPVKRQFDSTRPGVKDGGLTVGLAITGLALTAMGNLVSAISLWGSKKNYSVTFKSGDTTFGANNLTAKEALAVAGALEDRATASDIQVLISRK